MQSSVVIKGSKAGMTVILNPDVPFEQLIDDSDPGGAYTYTF